MSSLFHSLIADFPKLVRAMVYFEQKEESVPLPALVELKDVLHHVVVFADAFLKEDQQKQNEQITNVKEHFRRGIIETYQQAYEQLAGFIFDLYSKYRYRAKVYEKVFFLDKKFAKIHKSIEENIQIAKDLWVKGRELKNFESESADFNNSIDNFRKAYDILKQTEPLVNELWATFNQRVFYSVAFFVVIIIVFLIFVL